MAIDFYVSAVRYTSDSKTGISHVKVHPTSSFIKPQNWTKYEAIQTLHAGKIWYTTFLGNDNKWKTGERIHMLAINGVSYLRTDTEDIPEDKLENLPEF